MMRGARIVLAVVVIFSVAYVLMTPDPTDDVDGVLPNHQAKAQRLVSLSLPQLQVLFIVAFLLSMPSTRSAQRLTTSELLDLVCVCRC
jgi:hypothetical protein